MTPYWLLFIFPVLATVAPFRGDVRVRSFAFGIFASIAIGMIGLRYQVGGDWEAYLAYLDLVKGMGLLEMILLQDPGYLLINWLSEKMGLGITGVNLIGGGLFIYGLLFFCKQQPLPWLGIAVATPFLIIVVGMGYSRQAIALGFIFLAMSVWSEKNFTKYIILAFIAALFHKSAAVMFFLPLFISNEKALAKAILIFPILAIVAYKLIVSSAFESQFYTYFFTDTYDSTGGLVRVIMNVVPAMILLFFYSQFSKFTDNKLWLLIAALSIISTPLAFQFSTVVDRFAIYLAPIQIAVYSRLPVLVKNQLCRALIVILVLVTYAIVLFIWLNYAIHAQFWLPYQWILGI